MTSGFFNGDVMKGLAARVLFFLSLALLPIGLIAIAQTREISEQNEVSTELSLLALTEQASGAERKVFQEAFGAADALASIVLLHLEDPDECSEFFRAYRDSKPRYGLVGFIPLSGLMTCSSTDRIVNFSEDEDFLENLEMPVRRASAQSIDRVSQRVVTVVSAPVYRRDELLGFIAISIPRETFEEVEEPELAYEPVTLFTFNPKAQILTTEDERDLAEQEAPSTVNLSLLTDKKPSVFRAQNQDGLERIYAVQPLVNDAAYAISVWPVDAPFLVPDLATRLGAFLPILMWAASLIVAFWALNRLALRHIRKLGRQMRRFALNRNLPRVALGSSVPSELRDMEAAFINMGESILRDEAQLEDSLREKNILLKEVHHRVKNNLQLISSIMNMQIRQAETEDVSRVLRRLQERILSLATVHKNLYQNDNLVQVDAKALMSEVADQLLAVGLEMNANVEITQSYADVKLEADDAAPLTLLVSEAVTNAIKYVPREGGERSEIEIILTQEEGHRARLTVANTIGARPEQGVEGLGARLIQAFARQLSGEIEITENDRSYRLTIDFPLPQQPKQIYDY
jgi:two-component sensor histidine kinase